MWSGALPPNAPMSTSVAASASGLKRRRRSYGGMASNSGLGDDSAGVGRRKPLPCSKRFSVVLGFFLHLRFTTRKPLNELVEAEASNVLIYAHRVTNALCRLMRGGNR